MEIKLNNTIFIPDSALVFTTSRSTGPGGQHVNKVNSRVTLHFNLNIAPSLTDQQKRQIFSVLRTRVNKEGVLQLHSQKYRNQSANREDLVERFQVLLEQALRPKRPRIPTKTPKATKNQRLQDKKRHGRLKLGRSSQFHED